MTVRVQILLDADAPASLIVQYIAVNPVKPRMGDTNQRLASTLKQTVQPGESIQVELIHGYSSLSLHEGEPVVRLLPAPPADKARE